MHRFYGLAARLRQSFGERVQKYLLISDSPALTGTEKFPVKDVFSAALKAPVPDCMKIP